MDSIPPTTRAAMVQHIKMVVYKGDHCWSKALQVFPDIPIPELGGGD